MTATAETLLHDLLRLGIAPGQRVILHSSLRALGRVRGGAEAVIEAFQSALGPSGTLVMPVFTYSLPMWSTDPFDPEHSPSLTGLITETFRKMPGVFRSDHPTHSYATWGDRAEEIAAAQRDATGMRSPLGWLLEHGGKIVQLGTDQATNTALHLCEELAEVPYLDIAFTAGQSFETAHRRTGSNGDVDTVRIEPVPGSSHGFPRIQPVLEASGIIQEGSVAQARTLVTSINALVGVLVPVLRSHPGLLLSTRLDDEIGQRRRRALHLDPKHRLSDLIDLFIEGFPGGQRLTWAEREAIHPAAQQAANQAFENLCGRGDPTPEGVRSLLREAGASIDIRDIDAFAFSACEAKERRITIWRGAIERLVRAMALPCVPCAEPLHHIGSEEMLDLALVHEAFHLLFPSTPTSLQARLIDEIAARLFADALLKLPAPALLIDVWIMHWAPDALSQMSARSEEP